MSDKKKVKLYVYAEKFTSNETYEIKVESFIPATETWRIITPLSEVEIEIDLPAFSEKQLQLAEVESLKASLTKEKADSHVRVTAIEERIQSLLCLEAIA